MKKLGLVFCLLLIVFLCPLRSYAGYYGIVTSGEICLMGGTGCTDAGKLLRMSYLGRIYETVGDTGVEDGTAMAFDSLSRKLYLATAGCDIYELNWETAEAVKIVDMLLADPSPPPDVILAGPIRFLTGLAYDPVTTELLAVVSDSLTEFLVRLELENIDAHKNLAVEIIGVLGSMNEAYPGAPLGFSGAVIEFDPGTGQLYGAGIDRTASTAHPALFVSQTTPGNIPLASRVGMYTADVVSFPRAMMIPRFSSNRAYATGLRRNETEDLVNVYFSMRLDTGERTYMTDVTGLDGQISGLVDVIEFPPQEEEPPTISGFKPAGGNTGVPVRIQGSGFTANGEAVVTAVRFGPPGEQVNALGTPVVYTDSVLQVIAPTASSGPIEVVTSFGSAASETDFIRSDLLVQETEFNQGIPSQPEVVGKNMVVRLLTASSESTPDQPIPVTFGEVNLSIIKPGGETIHVIPSTPSRMISNGPGIIEPSQIHNINFYVDGDHLDEPGTYDFNFTVREFNPTQPSLAPVLYSDSIAKTMEPRRCDITMLVVLGGIEQDGHFTGPGDLAMGTIPKIFTEMSRIYPVRNSVSRLRDDRTAGVRFDIASTAVILGNSLGSFDFTDDEFDAMKRTVMPILDAYNENSFDRAVFANLLFDDELLSSEAGSKGKAEKPGFFSTSKLLHYEGIGIEPLSSHELGHNFGLVSKDSPNYDEDNGHTKNLRFPSEDADPANVRAFNLQQRRALAGLPFSIMAAVASDLTFFEDVEYGHVLSGSLLERNACSGSSIPDDTGGGIPPFDRRIMTLIAAITPDDEVDIVHSYVSDSSKPLSQDQTDGTYSMVFLDDRRQALATHPFGVSFGSTPFARQSSTDSEDVVTLVQEFPESAAFAQIRKGSVVLKELRQSQNAPTVQIQTQLAGQSALPGEVLVLNWTASDTDGESLTYSIEYSTDGVYWKPVAGGLRTQNFKWAPDYAAGSASGKIRVIASDGFNTAASESAAFMVPPKPPTASILSPKNQQTFLENQAVLLHGFAFDLEAGMLDGPFITWRSDISGPLGSGQKLELQPRTLVPGTHVITMVARDRDSGIMDVGDHIVIHTVSIVIQSDQDRDGLPDEVENQYDSLDPDDPSDAGGDMDGDGLTAAREIFLGSNPENPDTDGDGVGDGVEASQGRGPGSLPPVLDPIGNQTILEGETLTFVVSADDPEGDELIYIARGLPEGASFNTENGTFRYTPDFSVSGKDGDRVFEPTFTITDLSGERTGETITLTVLDVNRPPVAMAGGDTKQICDCVESTAVTLDGSASRDPDGDTLVYTWTGSFGTATGVRPVIHLPLGPHNITLTVNDGAADSEPYEFSYDVEVEVDGLNRPLAELAREGEDVIFPKIRFRRGRLLPARLKMRCRNQVLTGRHVHAPEIVGLTRDGVSIPPELMLKKYPKRPFWKYGWWWRHRKENDLFFDYKGCGWMFKIRTRRLEKGEYVMKIHFPDGTDRYAGFRVRDRKFKWRFPHPH